MLRRRQPDPAARRRPRSSAFADKACAARARCSSLVGRAELVMPMWERLEAAWGPARDVREHQPLLALVRSPSCDMDPGVRQVRPEELDAYLVAAVDMFIGEVGRRPAARRRRPRLPAAGGRLIAAGRAWARFERGEVVFKAEVGSQSPAVGQIQGVWVHPEWRGRRPGHGRHRDGGRRIVGEGPGDEPLCQRLQHGGARRVRPGGLHRDRHLRDGAVLEGSSEALASRCVAGHVPDVARCRESRRCRSAYSRRVPPSSSAGEPPPAASVPDGVGLVAALAC